MAHRGYTADPNSDGRRSSSEYGTLHVTPTERGYASDPNAEILSSVASSYKRPINKWVYYQDYETLQQQLPASGDIGDLFDKEFSFKCTVTSGIVDHTFASIKVVDGAEPIAPPDEADVDLGDLAIDSDGLPALQAFTVNPSTLDVYDGFLISSNLPRPINWDGGLFADWNTGINIDGLVYRILGEDPNKVQELEVFRYVVFEDGSLIECDGFDQQTFLEVSREFGYATQFNPGDILGRINYEVIECVAVITDWSHYNWDSDAPIRKAFRALIKNLPDTVSNIYVPVIESGNSQLKTSPDRALWTALGFVPMKDNTMMLIYSPDDNLVPY